MESWCDAVEDENDGARPAQTRATRIELDVEAVMPAEPVGQ